MTTILRSLYFFVVFSLTVLSVGGQINVDRVISIGRNAIYFEDYLLSIQYFNTVIKTKPYLAEPYFYRGVAKYFLEDFKGAELDCNLCLEKNPFIVDAYQFRGLSLMAQKRYDGAIADFERGLSFNPEHRQMLVNRALCAVELEDSLGAMGYFDEIVRVFPRWDVSYLLRGAYSFTKDDFVSANLDFDRSLDLNKNNATAYGYKGAVLSKQKDYLSAIDQYSKALRLSPGHLSFYLNRAVARYELKDLRGAMSDLDQVVNRDSSHVVGLFNRGLLRGEVGDYNRALSDFDRVVELKPDDVFAYYNRALLRQTTGDLRGAVEDLTRVLSKHPNYLPGYYLRSELYLSLNDRGRAEQDYRFASSLEESHRKNPGSVGVVSSASSGGTRGESEDDIGLFNRLIASGDGVLPERYDNQLRGKVQDRDVVIDIEPSFVLSYYDDDLSLRKGSVYSPLVSSLNSSGFIRQRLRLINKELPLSDILIEAHFRSIDAYSDLIERDGANGYYYLGRSLDYMLVQDLSSAFEDIQRALVLLPDDPILLFVRAVIRTKEYEVKLSSEIERAESMYDLRGVDLRESSSAKTGDVLSAKIRSSLDFELIFRDYDRIISLSPDFALSYYNKGCLRSRQKDYRGAISDFTMAISCDDGLAEAYFNRGLLYVYLGNREDAEIDLSKAGELGVSGAYNILKRISSE